MHRIRLALLHLHNRGDSLWEVDAALTGVVLQRVLNSYGGWEEALKQKDPHWQVVDLLQAYYDSISSPNLIKEALDLLQMDAAARAKWLQEHQVSHEGTSRRQQKALREATRVSERVYGAQLAPPAAAAVTDGASAAEDCCDAPVPQQEELSPGSKRARLLQIKHEVREKVELNQSFKSLLTSTDIPEVQVADAEQVEGEPAKKKRKPTATTIGIIKHKAIIALKDKEIAKLKAEVRDYTARLADMIVKCSLTGVSQPPTVISGESAPTPRSSQKAPTPAANLQVEHDKLKQRYQSLLTAAMKVSFSQSAANLEALQQLMISQANE